MLLSKILNCFLKWLSIASLICILIASSSFKSSELLSPNFKNISSFLVVIFKGFSLWGFSAIYIPLYCFNPPDNSSNELFPKTSKLLNLITPPWSWEKISIFAFNSEENLVYLI